mmetsp:Transcript_77067/g.222928  ORF Transcript_77067/g.222928 Transcript_77067/m.222928 type:complete len:350 (+) Transcript_77067:408-1457(+)
MVTIGRALDDCPHERCMSSGSSQTVASTTCPDDVTCWKMSWKAASMSSVDKRRSGSGASASGSESASSESDSGRLELMYKTCLGLGGDSPLAAGAPRRLTAPSCDQRGFMASRLRGASTCNRGKAGSIRPTSSTPRLLLRRLSKSAAEGEANVKAAPAAEASELRRASVGDFGPSRRCAVGGAESFDNRLRAGPINCCGPGWQVKKRPLPSLLVGAMDITSSLCHAGPMDSPASSDVLKEPDIVALLPLGACGDSGSMIDGLLGAPKDCVAAMDAPSVASGLVGLEEGCAAIAEVPSVTIDRLGPRDDCVAVMEQSSDLDGLVDPREESGAGTDASCGLEARARSAGRH